MKKPSILKVRKILYVILRTGPKQRIETKALLAAVEAVRAKVKVSHEAAGVILAATQVLP